MNSNVVNLPFVEKREGQEINCGIQLELFNSEEIRQPSWVLLNPNDYSQEVFLRILARNSFNLILDLRLRPVFSRPRYDHKSVMRYFCNSELCYIDLAKIAQGKPDEFDSFFSNFRQQYRAENSSSFVTLCLADDDAAEIVCEFRREIHRLGDHLVELHPKSVLR